MEIRRTLYRPLRIGLFIYDAVRMLIMLDLLIAVIPLGEEPRLRWFPYLVYAAPNAIFPLIGFFLLIRPGEYRPFTHLYLAGKTVSLAATLAWIAFSVQSIISSMSPGGEASIRAFFTSLLLSRDFVLTLRGVLLLLFLDAASLLGGRLLKKGLAPESSPQPPPEPPDLLPENTMPSGGGLP
jgi:hypothetical protein